MRRRGSSGAYGRRGAVSRLPGVTPGQGSLIPGAVTASTCDRESAFIGRLQTAGDGGVYMKFMHPYAAPSGSYDLANRMIKTMYHRYVIDLEWDGLRFLRILLWALENRLAINRFTFDNGSRLYDRGSLPYGAMSAIPANVIRTIVGPDGGC